MRQPRYQREGLVGGSLDLVTMLLKVRLLYLFIVLFTLLYSPTKHFDMLMFTCKIQNAPIEIVRAVFDKCFDLTVQLILESEDHAEMQVRIS